jgi:hypothetical protein
MHLRFHKRIRRGWEDREIETTPAEVKRLKEETQRLLAFRTKGKKPCGCYARTDNPDRVCHFHALKIGEEITGTASGTLSELFAAGLEPAPIRR